MHYAPGGNGRGGTGTDTFTTGCAPGLYHGYGRAYCGIETTSEVGYSVEESGRQLEFHLAEAVADDLNLI